MIDVKLEVSKALSNYIKDIEQEELYNMLEVPPNKDMGDLALPCFKLSKILRKSPVLIAQELASSIGEIKGIEKIEPLSGYLNFFLDKTLFISDTLSFVLSQKESYGSADIGKGKNVVIDYSAPNIAKPFHIGHLRSTVIGGSLYRIFKFLGYNPIGVNHLGDWGTQFGKLIVAFKKWGNEEKVKKGLIKELMALYVKFHDEAEKDPTLDDEARGWFKRMEDGDEEALKLWKWFVEISLEEFQKVYHLLDIKFDSYNGESFYNDKMDAVIDKLKEKDLVEESEGALIVNLDEYDMPPCLILKKDGSTLYATRDITAAIYRKNTYDFDKCIYVTGVSQSLHFKQWFKVIELMGYDWHKDLHHVPFGTVSLGGEKLATRKGKVVLLEDILNLAIEKTLEVIEAKNPNLENKEEVARQIGVGSVIFSDMFSNRIKDVSFSWDEILNFDGETGPYVQYTHARACSVLRKAEVDIDSNLEFNSSLLSSPQEYQLAKSIADFPEKVKQALNDLEPSVITRYLVELAHEFNRFYHEHPILVDDKELRAARLALVVAAKIALANGLKLICLHTPEKV